MNGASLKQSSINRSIINCGSNTTTAAIEPSTSSSTITSGCKRALNPDDDDNSAEIERQRIKTDIDESKSSPIKSLSSMVSSPISTSNTVQNMNHNFYKTSPSVDPISANLTSCLCKRLNISCNNNCNEQQRSTTDSEPCCSSSLINAVPVPRIIPFHHRPSSSSLSSIVVKPKQSLDVQEQEQPTTVAQKGTNETLINTDNPALAEASRNLTQTLRKLSKRVFTSKAHIENNVVNRSMTSSSNISSGSSSSSSSSSSTSSSSNSSGAVIESMKHHGKGIYSGTFSGTLNPALQDKNGRPKRDISTIIHILNDLLSATPQCGKNGAKIFFEPTQTTGSSASSSTTKFIKVG